MSIFAKYSKKKAVALLLAAALLLVSAVGGTLAYLSATTGSLTNSFSPATVNCAIVENISDNVKTSVKIQNTGDVDAFIRVAVIVNTVDASGNIIGSEDPDQYIDLTGSGWVKGSDGFYYYNGVRVESQGLTSELLKTGGVDLSNKSVTILAEAIQADGMNTATAMGAFDYASANGSTGGGE